MNFKVEIVHYYFQVVPILTILLINQIRIRELLYLVQDFHVEMKSLGDINGLCWSYALAIDILLDTGYPLVTFEEVKGYYHSDLEEMSPNKLVDNIAFSRFYINMWLW
jgi:hypothetical protein